MSGARDARLATAIAGLRTPIARIQLAAGRLEGLRHPPLASDVAGSLRDAVAELDRDVELLLGALATPGGAARSSCARSLDEILARLAPALDARGCRCERERDVGSADDDACRVRRAALQLLRSGSRFAGRGGHLRIGLVAEPSRYAIRVEADAPSTSGPDGAAQPDTDELRRFALAEGGELDLETSAAGRWTAALWFPRDAS
ncbi:MAG: hypothetical protein ACR2N6_02435 [Miltoncostaeaceae bacterium]